jgi:hypothetical protein
MILLVKASSNLPTSKPVKVKSSWIKPQSWEKNMVLGHRTKNDHAGEVQPEILYMVMGATRPRTKSDCAREDQQQFLSSDSQSWVSCCITPRIVRQKNMVGPWTKNDC